MSSICLRISGNAGPPWACPHDAFISRFRCLGSLYRLVDAASVAGGLSLAVWVVGSAPGRLPAAGRGGDHRALPGGRTGRHVPQLAGRLGRPRSVRDALHVARRVRPAGRASALRPAAWPSFRGCCWACGCSARRCSWSVARPAAGVPAVALAPRTEHQAAARSSASPSWAFNSPTTFCDTPELGLRAGRLLRRSPAGARPAAAAGPEAADRQHRRPGGRRPGRLHRPHLHHVSDAGRRPHSRRARASWPTRPPASISCPTSSSFRCCTRGGPTSAACRRSACSRTRCTASMAWSSASSTSSSPALLLVVLAVPMTGRRHRDQAHQPRAGLLPPAAVRPGRPARSWSGNSAR